MIKAIFALSLLLAVPAAGAPSVSEQVFSEADGTSTLSHSVFVSAPPAEVWAAITTVEGWTSWAVPVAWIAPHRPHVIETSYDPASRPGDASNIENEFLVRVPDRKLVFHTVKAPAGFPHFDALKRVTQTFALTPAANGTQVSLTGTGYGADPAGQAVLAFFQGGNRVSLEMLRDRFINGPINWTEKLKKPLK